MVQIDTLGHTAERAAHCHTLPHTGAIATLPRAAATAALPHTAAVVALLHTATEAHHARRRQCTAASVCGSVAACNVRHSLLALATSPLSLITMANRLVDLGLRGQHGPR